MKIMWMLLCSPLCLSPAAEAQFQFSFDASQTVWTLSNGVIEVSFQLTSDNTFGFRYLRDLRNGDLWMAPANRRYSPIRFQVNDKWIDANTMFRLVSQTAESVDRHGYKQSILLEDLHGLGRVELNLLMYWDQPVLRYGVKFLSLQPQTVTITAADMLPWGFDDQSKGYHAFRVNQWTVAPKLEDFEPFEQTLDPQGHAFRVQSGAHGQQCGWLAFRDEDDRGMFTGWEFDGRASAAMRQMAGSGDLELASLILNLHHPVDANQQFQIPYAFIGTFHGDWDEAGYRTQRFTEAALAQPPPDAQNFPYVSWDSWAYQTDFDEQTLAENARIAASIGIELFVVDLGWARRLGDWRADESKFPSGLRALSDYVHSLGMKFGIHFALAEVDPSAPVLQEYPDWTSSESYGYFDALSLCLSNRPTREWLINEAVRMIDEYNVDWILQDGENMVKKCTKETHTHDPMDSNYANAVEGINAVVEAVQQLRPNTHWENCENGGNMMTFNMASHYVTSIANDASGALNARKAVYGVTYPFPPRYSDRYMPHEKLNSYVTRSFMFGGPWIFMNRLREMTPEDLAFAASEIQLYKTFRGMVRDGKVFHLTARPAAGHIDALESYDEAADRALAVVTRARSAPPSVALRLRGLKSESSYRLRFQNDGRTFVMSGAQLMRDGIQVGFPDQLMSEIVYVDPLN